MELAKDLKRRNIQKNDKVAIEIKDCQAAIESLQLELKSASFEYKFYQEMRGYMIDVIDCFNEKVNRLLFRLSYGIRIITKVLFVASTN